jgi:hypothetical protein
VSGLASPRRTGSPRATSDRVGMFLTIEWGPEGPYVPPPIPEMCEASGYVTGDEDVWYCDLIRGHDGLHSFEEVA